MKFSSVLRLCCVTAVAVMAVTSVVQQPDFTIQVNTELSNDFLRRADTAKATAKLAPVLNDWQFTRARPPKCPFF